MLKHAVIAWLACSMWCVSAAPADPFVPFGMVQLSPDTQTRYVKESYPWAGGYQYGDPTILGFSHTHFSGAGHSDLGDVLMMPISGAVRLDPGAMNEPLSGYRPTHHIAYLYAYAGQPWRTHARLEQIVDSQYHPQPDGLSGNDDLGQMPAWLLFTSLGLYPVTPASGEYVIGRPFVDRATTTVSQAP